MSFEGRQKNNVHVVLPADGGVCVAPVPQQPSQGRDRAGALRDRARRSRVFLVGGAWRVAGSQHSRAGGTKGGSEGGMKGRRRLGDKKKKIVASIKFETYSWNYFTVTSKRVSV